MNSSSQPPLTGGCYCGTVRFEANAAPTCQSNCHCANCRRAIGAQSVAWVTVTRAAFRFASAAPKRFRTDTGAWRSFCDQCGTSLTFEHDTRPDEIDLTVGSLDHPENFPPTVDSFPEEKLAWTACVSATPDNPAVP